ncbi:MAG: flagellar basal body P-ring formation chaperone FlgA, partial [Curvibacter sp.]
ASRVGLRCLEGATRWNVTMPVTVEALGTAWVLRRDVAPGTPLQAEDLEAAEVDWAAEPSPVLAGREVWAGQVAARALRAGQTLRENLVRAEQVFQAGAQVRVLVQGGGFRISAQAQALSAGVVGQPARVKMESGRVLTATVLDARTVRVEI